MEVKWIKVPNVAQYKKADWSNEMARHSNTTANEARVFAERDPNISYYFFTSKEMFLEGKTGKRGWEEKGAFNPGDAVFFRGLPRYGRAPQSDIYLKQPGEWVDIGGSYDKLYATEHAIYASNCQGLFKYLDLPGFWKKVDEPSGSHYVVTTKNLYRHSHHVVSIFDYTSNKWKDIEDDVLQVVNGGNCLIVQSSGNPATRTGRVSLGDRRGAGWYGYSEESNQWSMLTTSEMAGWRVAANHKNLYAVGQQSCEVNQLQGYYEGGVYKNRPIWEPLPTTPGIVKKIFANAITVFILTSDDTCYHHHVGQNAWKLVRKGSKFEYMTHPMSVDLYGLQSFKQTGIIWRYKADRLGEWEALGDHAQQIWDSGSKLLKVCNSTQEVGYYNDQREGPLSVGKRETTPEHLWYFEAKTQDVIGAGFDGFMGIRAFKEEDSQKGYTALDRSPNFPGTNYEDTFEAVHQKNFKRNHTYHFRLKSNASEMTRMIAVTGTGVFNWDRLQMDSITALNPVTSKCYFAQIGGELPPASHDPNWDGFPVAEGNLNKPITGFEFKIILDKEKFKRTMLDGQEIDKFWDAIGAFVPIARKKSNKPAKSRTIQYLDTNNRSLDGSNIILRERIERGGKATNTRTLTFKLRNKDWTALNALVAVMSNGNKSGIPDINEKFEGDVTINSDQFSLSISATADLEDYPTTTIAQAAVIFPQLESVLTAIGKYKPNQELSIVNGLSITETAYKNYKFKRPKSPKPQNLVAPAEDDITLTTWDSNSATQVVELSFSVKIAPDTNLANTYAFFRGLYSKLAHNEWINPRATTKTKFIYQHAGQDTKQKTHSGHDPNEL